MTNKQWLNTLSDYQLALWMTTKSDSIFVKGREEPTKTAIEKTAESNIASIVQWLGNEREEE